MVRRFLSYFFSGLWLITLLGITTLQASPRDAATIAGISANFLFELNQQGLQRALAPYLREKSNIRSVAIIDMLDNSTFWTYQLHKESALYNQPLPEACAQQQAVVESAITHDGDDIGLVRICFEVAAGQVLLSSEELAWLTVNPVLRVHNERDFAPFNFNHNGTPAGLSVDLMNLMAEKVGARIEYVTGEWSDLLNMAMNRKLDVMLNIAHSEDRAQHLLYVGKMMENPNAIFARSSDPSISDIESLAGKKVAVVDGFFQEKLLRDQYPLIQRLVVGNVAEALRTVAYGRADATIGSRLVNNYTINDLLLSGINVKGEFAADNPHATELHIAVRNNAPLLQGILSKALAAVTPVEMSAIRKRWVIGDIDNQQLILPQALRDWIAEHPKIVVGGEMDWAPFDYVDERGEYAGLAKDYLDLIAKMTGLKFEVRTGLRWNELLDALQTGEIDMLPALNFSSERESFINFTQPYLTLSDYFFTRRETAKIDSMQALAGSKLAVVKGYEVVDWLRAKHPEIVLHEADSIIDALRLVESGEALAMINDNPSTTYNMGKYFITNIEIRNLVPERSPNHLHMGVKKGYEPLVEILNQSLRHLSQEDRRLIASHWMSSVEGGSGSLDVTDQERQYLLTRPTLKFAVDPNWLPIEGINREGSRYEGMMADLLQQIADLSGIHFELVATEKWSESVALATQGEVQMLAAVSKTAEREKFLNFSSRTFELNDGILTRADAGFINDLGELQGMRVGVSQGTSVEAMLKREYPKLILVPVQGTMNGIQQLLSKKIDAYVDNLEVAGYIINQEGFYNLKVAMRLPQRRHIFIALRKDLPDAALSIINKAIAAIPDADLNTIRQRWVGLKVSDGFDYALLWKLALGVLVIFIFFTWNNYRLQRLVAAKTADIEKQKERLIEFNRTLEERVEERTQMLASREAHIRTVMDNVEDAIVSINPYGIIESANRATQAIFGYPAAEIVGKNIKMLMQQQEAMQHDRYMARYSRTSQGEIVGRGPRERIGKHRDGHEIFLEVSVGEVNLNETRLYVGVLRDISERKEAEHRLQDAFEVITGSIQYASRIQRSILPRDTEVSKMLPHAFITWEPRDVVGGDIYWIIEWGAGVYVILGDCTGHGVPGAFMTLISNGALEHSIDLVNEGDCAALLGHMHRTMQLSLGQHREGGDSDDGIELGMVYIPRHGGSLTYAGARFSLFYHDLEGEVVEVKGDKRGIAYRAVPHQTVYTNTSVERPAGRRFIMSTDGLVDQVGGEKRRMLGKKRFMELLLASRQRPITEVGDTLYAEMVAYMGEEKRRDDVSLIGFECS
ncbi:MAG: transporter substrate-binding domain-containing protein [Gammaproteobacteria bacterium]|nr:transporter substrate-binding domain-containing protein [Gammaproteobacteria bacterium]